MKVLALLAFLLTSCSEGEFTTAETKPGGGEGELRGEIAPVIATGMDYTGDPIILKEKPSEKILPIAGLTRSKTWKVNETEQISGEVTLDSPQISHMRKILPNLSQEMTESFKQVSRKKYRFSRMQPGQTSEGTEEETFSQADRGILDILLVIDNSGSMADEIKKVRENLSSLLSEVSGSNWQISMVKSDPHNTCSVEGKITADMANHDQEYEDMLNFTLLGGTEHMLKKARWALEGKSGCDNSWLRSDSTVAVIVVSDEPHQCPNSSYCSLTAYRSFVEAFAHQIKTYGFTNWSATNQSIFSKHGSINSSSYTNVLQEISKNIQANLQDVFTLARTPDGKSITVKVNDTVIPRCETPEQSTDCFEIVTTTSASGNTSAVQFFNYTPPKASSITVDYSYGGIAFERSWELQHEPLPNEGMTVTVTKENGTVVKLDKGRQYRLNGDVLSIRGNVENVVPQGSTLQVDYLENIPLQTKFVLSNANKLPSGATLEEKTVKINIGGKDGEFSALYKKNDAGDFEIWNIVEGKRTLSFKLKKNGSRFDVYKKVNTRWEKIPGAENLKAVFTFDGSTIDFPIGRGTTPVAGIEGKHNPGSFSVHYKYYRDLKSAYLLTKHTAHEQFTCSNAGSSVDCTHSNKMITFTDTSDFKKGDIITITETLSSPNNTISLEDTGYIADEDVNIEFNGKKCKVNDKISSNQEIDLKDALSTICTDLSAKANDTINYNYSVYTSDAKNFPVGNFMQMDKKHYTDNRGNYKFEYWVVMINGVEIAQDKFEIKDYKVKLDDYGEIASLADLKKLGNNAEVTVTVYLYHAL